MKAIIINRFDEQAYINAVQDTGNYLDLDILEDDKNISKYDMVVSTNFKYRHNYCRTLRDALIKLDLNIYDIPNTELENRTLDFIIS